MRLYLIRHGENDFVGKKLAGRLPGVHLNQRGQAQADAMPKLLAEVNVGAIYSSPLERAVETATPLARTKQIPLHQREALNEIDYGTWEGKSLGALSRRKLWPVIQSSPSLARFPEGESFNEAQARIVGELERIIIEQKQTRGAAVCVFHSDPIKLALAHFIGLHLDHFQRLTIAPASISIVEIHEHGVRILTLNDTRATKAYMKG
jgi:probable phosphomutase (TIGR03848 family)